MDQHDGEGDRRFFKWLFGFIGCVLVLGLIAIGYAVGFSNGKDEGRKVQPAAAQVSTTAAQAPGTTTTQAPAQPSGGTSLTINMSEYAFSPKDPTTNAGTVKISTPNNGQVQHELVLLKTNQPAGSLPTLGNGEVDEEGLEANGVDSPGEIEDVGPSETKSGTFKLTPGKYVMICNLPSHYRQGMYGTLTVK
jgi:uncharacterized cupredoxin-like copper-binding protein